MYELNTPIELEPNAETPFEDGVVSKVDGKTVTVTFDEPRDLTKVVVDTTNDVNPQVEAFDENGQPVGEPTVRSVFTLNLFHIVIQV